MNKLSITQIEDTRRLYVEYIKGESLAKLANRLGVTKRCIQYRFKTYIHPSYHRLARKGTLAEMKRYFSSKHQSSRAKKEIQEWLVNNLDQILEFENNNATNFFTESKLNQYTRRDLPFIEDLYLSDPII